MTNTETIIRDIYDAWRTQDLDWLASYLPDDFCHVMYIPRDLYSMGGTCQGKSLVLKRWGLILPDFEFLRFDTSELMIEKDHAAAEITLRYRHKPTDTIVDTTKASIWRFEAGWPVKLTEYYNVELIAELPFRLRSDS